MWWTEAIFLSEEMGILLGVGWRPLSVPGGSSCYTFSVWLPQVSEPGLLPEGAPSLSSKAFTNLRQATCDTFPLVNSNLTYLRLYIYSSLHLCRIT